MKLFRILIVFLYFTMGLDMDMFVVGKDIKVISSGELEMFPILRSRKYLYIYFFLDRTVQRFELFVLQVLVIMLLE